MEPRLVFAPRSKQTRRKLRWVNLWWRFEAVGDLDSSCHLDTEAEMGGAVFAGNLLLVMAILLGIFLLHVVVVSAIEAYWLSKVNRGGQLTPRAQFVQDAIEILAATMAVVRARRRSVMYCR